MNQPFFAEATAWTTVLAARSGGEDVRLAALERLFTRYRRPICLEFQARKHCTPDEAEEAAHQFIHDCLRRDFLRSVDPGKGRFRTFIQACIVNFIRDERDRHGAAKRGGGQAVHSLDETGADGCRLHEPPAPSAQLDLMLDRNWAHHLVTLVLERLEAECAAARRRAIFTTLRPYLQSDPPDGACPAAAVRLGISDGAVRTAIWRLRQRFRELLEEEIRETTGADTDWREEVRHLLDVLVHNPPVTAGVESR
jgi:RNA polymerase sigma-70 factor (ECF subfamily)